jgi:hypothetical protein
VGKRGPRKYSELMDELRRARSKPLAGARVVIPFRDGTIEVPLAPWRKIVERQRHIVREMKGGHLGGRPSRYPGDDALFLHWSDHWLQSGLRYKKARRTFLREVERTYSVTVRQARRWCDRALGPLK